MGGGVPLVAGRGMGVNVFLLTANECPPLSRSRGTTGAAQWTRRTDLLWLTAPGAAECSRSPFNFVTLFLTYATHQRGVGRGFATGRGLGRGVGLSP
jgi:hypothetical protein